MVDRLTALTLATLLFVGNVAAVHCAGWQVAASDRMACCARAGHDCGDQLAADQCCAAGEQAQQSPLTAAAAPIPLPASLAAVRPLLSPPPLQRLADARADRPQSPPHFRRTVLLI